VKATFQHALSSIQNHLLAALPTAEFERIAPDLELVAMPAREILCESGGDLPHVYFPTTSIVSLNCVFGNGVSTKITEVGNEGLIGISIFMGGNAALSLTVVDIGGDGYRVKARPLIQEFNRGGAMQHLLLRYTHARITQVSQTAVCNRHHSVEQQLSRWLLQTLDRLPSGELSVTQELIASMLGVRREGIARAAGHLQRAGCIHYGRGHIRVIDRSGLELRACECYAVIKNEFDRLFGKAQDHQAILSASHPMPSPWLHVANSRKAEGIRFCS
jgi:hypothetical protein